MYIPISIHVCDNECEINVDIDYMLMYARICVHYIGKGLMFIVMDSDTLIHQ